MSMVWPTLGSRTAKDQNRIRVVRCDGCVIGVCPTGESGYRCCLATRYISTPSRRAFPTRPRLINPSAMAAS